VVIIRDERTDKDIMMGLQSELSSTERPEVLFRLEDVDFPAEQSECLYSFLGKEEVMRKYTVVQGDNLENIAYRELGSASRKNEIVEANKDRYSSLKKSSFIEIGWELLLPPRWAPKSTGYITAFAGTLLSENESEYWVAKTLNDPAHILFSKKLPVKSFDATKLTRGACVVILNNRGTALGISSQDNDYVNLFKYGDNLTE
jgi:hypothetical protein